MNLVDIGNVKGLDNYYKSRCRDCWNDRDNKISTIRGLSNGGFSGADY